MTTYDDTTSDGLLDARISGWSLSYGLTALFNAVLTILKEMYPGLHDAMAAITGHHWVTHGLLDLIVFVVLGMLFVRSGREISAGSAVTSIAGGTIVGGLLIAGYFLF